MSLFSSRTKVFTQGNPTGGRLSRSRVQTTLEFPFSDTAVGLFSFRKPADDRTMPGANSPV